MTITKTIIRYEGKDYWFSQHSTTSKTDKWFSEERGIEEGWHRMIDGVLCRARKVYPPRFWWQKPSIIWEPVVA